jgi:hypothetical protein
MKIKHHGSTIVEIPTAPRHHAPRIDRDTTRIVGCTCGWRTPTGAADSDDTYAVHIAIEGAGGQL